MTCLSTETQCKVFAGHMASVTIIVSKKHFEVVLPLTDTTVTVSGIHMLCVHCLLKLETETNARKDKLHGTIDLCADIVERNCTHRPRTFADALSVASGNWCSE